MKAYRTSVKIKLGLIVAAVAIAVASLGYTNRLANRLMQQERDSIQLYARAIEYQAQSGPGNPVLPELAALDRALARGALSISADSARALRSAVAWAEAMPASEEIDFVFNEIIEPGRFSVPAIITDTLVTEVGPARNVPVDSSLTADEQQALYLERAREMDEVHDPIRVDYGDGFVQLVHYGESEIVNQLRWFPLVQLLFVAAFVGVGYLGFSYVRRSEQANLWVGMAKEAAHQLGTPLSSMIGWIELLRLEGEDEPDGMASTVADELERDVGRLRRVADRFSKIGSVPELQPQPLAPVVRGVAEYVGRRVPKEGRQIGLSVDLPDGLEVALNAELFEWVVENLLKNALDAIEGDGSISVRGRREKANAVIDVRDTGKGIDRAAARHVFRPGFSTKRRGWGLGLSLAKRIVEDYHGGTLALAESRVGQGTTFRITLPLAEPAR